MSDTIKAIADTINTPCPEQCNHDAAVYGCACASCTHAAERIYTAHVKPLEDALASAKERELVLVDALKDMIDPRQNFTLEMHMMALGKAHAALASVKKAQAADRRRKGNARASLASVKGAA